MRRDAARRRWADKYKTSAKHRSRPKRKRAIPREGCCWSAAAPVRTSNEAPFYSSARTGPLKTRWLMIKQSSSQAFSRHLIFRAKIVGQTGVSAPQSFSAERLLFRNLFASVLHQRLPGFAVRADARHHNRAFKGFSIELNGHILNVISLHEGLFAVVELDGDPVAVLLKAFYLGGQIVHAFGADFAVDHAGEHERFAGVAPGSK